MIDGEPKQVCVGWDIARLVTAGRSVEAAQTMAAQRRQSVEAAAFTILQWMDQLPTDLSE